MSINFISREYEVADYWSMVGLLILCTCIILVLYLLGAFYKYSISPRWDSLFGRLVVNVRVNFEFIGRHEVNFTSLNMYVSWKPFNSLEDSMCKANWSFCFKILRFSFLKLASSGLDRIYSKLCMT